MTARPRFATPPPAGPSWADAILAEMEGIGHTPLPWQEEAAGLIGAIREDGTPRYRTVTLSTPRQSGKSTLVRAVLSARAKRFPNQSLYISAQTRLDATKHLEILGNSLTGVKVRFGVGNERITWPNGSTLQVVAPTPGGAHGLTISQVVLDELWAVQPHLMAGVVPATVANRHAQMVLISTMGTVDSTVWNDLVAKGRESVEDAGSEMAYLEYSAESDQDVFDEALWPTFMPALGHTQTVEAVRFQRDTLSPSEFVRAFGNRTTVTLNIVFPDEWLREAWRIIEPPARLVLAVDVNEEPAGAALASGHLTDEGSAVRMIEWRYGTPAWVPGKVREVLQNRQVDAVVADFGGPARVIRPELEAICLEHNVPLVDRVPRDFGADTGSFYDALRERTINIEKSEPLSDAFAGAVRKDLGDLWVVSRRRMSVDASPLVSAILAHGVATELGVKPVLWYVLGGE